MRKLSAAIITDIHYGFDQGQKLGSKAPRLMDYFANRVAYHKPDMIVDLGDRISGKTPDDDRRYMRALKEHFNAMAAPLHSVVGNHDLRYLSRSDNQAIMGSSAESYSLEQGGYHLAFWNPSLLKGPKGLTLNAADLDWLREDLAAADKPCIVFCHFPVDRTPPDADTQESKRRFYFADADAVRDILEQSGKVMLYMNGHLHKNSHSEINGIHYVTQQSFTNMWRKHYRVPARAWSLLQLEDDKIRINLHGKTRKTLELQAPRYDRAA